MGAIYSLSAAKNSASSRGSSARVHCTTCERSPADGTVGPGTVGMVRLPPLMGSGAGAGSRTGVPPEVASQQRVALSEHLLQSTSPIDGDVVGVAEVGAAVGARVGASVVGRAVGARVVGAPVGVPVAPSDVGALVEGAPVGAEVGVVPSLLVPAAQ